MKEIKKY